MRGLWLAALRVVCPVVIWYIRELHKGTSRNISYRPILFASRIIFLLFDILLDRRSGVYPIEALPCRTPAWLLPCSCRAEVSAFPRSLYKPIEQFSTRQPNTVYKGQSMLV